MDRICGKRLQFKRLDDELYGAEIGPDRMALLALDGFGWRGLLISPDRWNPCGLYLARDFWNPDCLQKAALWLETLIDDVGSPKLKCKDESGQPNWYGTTELMSGPLLDGTGEWMKLGSKVFTFPKGKRRQLIPEVGRASWHPLVAMLQATSCAVAERLSDLKLLARANLPIAILDSRKRLAEAGLTKLVGLVAEAEAQNVPWNERDIMSPELARYVEEARATGTLNLSV